MYYFHNNNNKNVYIARFKYLYGTLVLIAQII